MVMVKFSIFYFKRENVNKLYFKPTKIPEVGDPTATLMSFRQAYAICIVICN